MNILRRDEIGKILNVISGEKVGDLSYERYHGRFCG